MKHTVRISIGILIIWLTSCHYCLHAQIITTYAGGDSLILGDGGHALSAHISLPNAVAFDPAGNLLIADWGNKRIRKVDAARIITTVAGDGSYGFGGDGGPATTAQIRIPGDVKVDSIGNIYILDVYNYRIRKVDISGIITTVAGNGIYGETGDGGPATAAAIIAGRIEVDRSGNIYIGYGGHIRKVDATTGIINTIVGGATLGYSGDGGPASAAQFNGIGGIMIDNVGNLYIGDGGNSRIRKVDTAGIVRTLAGNGVAGFSGDGGPATAAQFGYNIRSLWVDEAENIYVVDYINSRIRKVNALGIITTIAGYGGTGSFSGDGGPATAAELGNIASVTKQKGGGNIFIAVQNNRVRMITDTNHAAIFSGSHAVQLNLCLAPSDTLLTPVDTIALDALLTATDIDTGQVEKWQLVLGPFHGSVSGSYVTYTTGSMLTPSGITYTAASGYAGFDSFKIRVTDGYTADSITFHVRIDTTLPSAGTISGADMVCVGEGIALSGSSGSGAFSAAGTHVTVSGNIITGSVPGADTILYIVANACGADTAIHPLQVIACPDEVPVLYNSLVQLWPNPGDNEINITVGSQAYTSFIITNTIGLQMLRQSLTPPLTTVRVSKLPAGLYYITLTAAEGNVVKKFIKR